MDPARRLVDADEGAVIDRNKAGTVGFEGLDVKLIEATSGPRDLVGERPQGMQEASGRHRCEGIVPTPRMLVWVRFKRQQYRPALDFGRHHLASSSFL
jgi:hypothetical protein